MYFISSFFSDSIAKNLLGNLKFSNTVKMMVLCAGFQIIAEYPTALMRVREQAVLFTISNILKLILSLLLTIYFVVNLQRGVIGIYEANIIGFAFYILLLSGLLLKNISFRIEISILREMLQFSTPLMFASISGLLLTFADRFCIRYIGGIDDVGIYSLGYRIANTLKVVIAQSVFLALTPVQYKYMNNKDNKRFYSKILTYFCFGLMIFVLGISLYSREIVRVLSSSREYWSATAIIPVFSLTILFYSLKQTCLIGLNIKKRTGIIAYLTIIFAVLNICLNMLFIPLWKSMGAAIATLITQTLFFITIYKISQKHFYIPYEVKKIIIMVTLGSIIIGAGFLLNHLTLPIRIILKALLIVTFPILLYFFHFYEPIELLRLKQSWKKWRNPKNWKNNISKINFR